MVLVFPDVFTPHLRLLYFNFVAKYMLDTGNYKISFLDKKPESNLITSVDISELLHISESKAYRNIRMFRKYSDLYAILYDFDMVYYSGSLVHKVDYASKRDNYYMINPVFVKYISYETIDRANEIYSKFNQRTTTTLRYVDFVVFKTCRMKKKTALDLIRADDFEKVRTRIRYLKAENVITNYYTDNEYLYLGGGYCD